MFEQAQVKAGTWLNVNAKDFPNLLHNWLDIPTVCLGVVDCMNFGFE